MIWVSLLPLFLSPVYAAVESIRFGCGQLVVERMDPVVSPGMVQSGHLHQVTGGNSFNATMDPLDDVATASTCSTCTFVEDKSNYWTAVLFFKAQNGTYKRVPIKSLINGINGGMTVYYEGTFNGNTVKTTAFKKGFRMLAGSPTFKTAADVKGLRSQLSYTCISASGSRGAQQTDFPMSPCAGGIMVSVNFPSCWDGVNLDSSDHRSHMSYAAIKDAACPSSHPVKVPRILLETLWDTSSFNNDWPSGGQQPFLWSFGDTTGYGSHADYVFGWEGDSLQRAMDMGTACLNMNCAALKKQTTAAQNACVQKQKVTESVDGWLITMPGGLTA